MSKRPDRHTYFMEIAHVVAKRSTCPRLAVGAVLTEGNQIIATGYNGAPSGADHCVDVGCTVDAADHCVASVHAEANVLIQAARLGRDPAYSVLYVTHMPCRRCTSLIINADIYQVYYANAYKNTADEKLLEKVALKFFHIPFPA